MIQLKNTLWGTILGGSLVACAGGQSGTEGEKVFRCEVVDSKPIAADEETPAGTLTEVLALVPQSLSSAVRFYPLQSGASPVDGEIELQVNASVKAPRHVSRRGINCPDQAKCPDCPDLLQLDANVTVTSTPQLVGSFMGVIAYDGSQLVFAGDSPITDMTGSYDLSRVAKEYEVPALVLRTSLAPTASGQLTLTDQGTGESASNVSALVAEWPLP